MSIKFFIIVVSVFKLSVGLAQEPMDVDLGPGFCQLTRKVIEKTKVQALETKELQEVIQDLENREYHCGLAPRRLIIGHGVRGPWIFRHTLKFFCHRDDRTAMVYLRMTGDFESCHLYLRSISVNEY